jgi:hypothetical protein
MAPKKMEFTCIKANIADEDGNKVWVGEKVTFGKKMADHYRKLGFIEMPLPDFGDDEDDAITADEPATSGATGTAEGATSDAGESAEEEDKPKPAPKRRRL